MLVNLYIEYEFQVASGVAALVFSAHHKNLAIWRDSRGGLTKEKARTVLLVQGLDICEAGPVQLDVLVVEGALGDIVLPDHILI